jgi:lipid-binding SYLF domain-containing protein
MTALDRRAAAFRLAAVIAFAFAGLMTTAPARAQYTEQQELVDRARITLQTMLNDTEFRELPPYIRAARGVLIFPELVKGGFIIGAEGGSGVMLVRGGDGVWSSPSFVALAAGSIGLQIGGQVSEVVFTVMNAKAVEAILQQNFSLGADASIAVGPVGKGVTTATTSTSFVKDIYSFARTKGLFGGGSFEGAGFIERASWNTAYYGPGATARAILLERRFHNPAADPLRAVLPR